MPSKKAKPKFSLKDQLFNRARVNWLGELFADALPSFDCKAFVQQAVKPFPSLELKQRITHISQTLEVFLDDDFRVAASQIVQALPPPLDPNLTDDDFGDFIFAPLGEFVASNGIASKHVALSLKTLKEITKRFSMEYAIRDFLNAHPEKTLEALTKWSKDSNYHVRRLVSEGTRPKLPWGKGISIDSSDSIPLLDALHADPTRYVTRSVCNHLNDLAKSDPKLVLGRLRAWQKMENQTPNELQWMLGHALRTLVKQGDPAALKMLGYRSSPKIVVDDFEMRTPTVRRGAAFEFSFEVAAQRDERLMVDYVVDFAKSAGKRSKKVHKLKQFDLDKGEIKKLSKKHLMKDNATTYQLYPGTHHVTLQINGKSFGKKSFELI